MVGRLPRQLSPRPVASRSTLRATSSLLTETACGRSCLPESSPPWPAQAEVKEAVQAVAQAVAQAVVKEAPAVPVAVPVVAKVAALQAAVKAAVAPRAAPPCSTPTP